MGEGFEPVLEPVDGLGLLQRGDQVDEGSVVDPPFALGGGDGEADGQVIFYRLSVKVSTPPALLLRAVEPGGHWWAPGTDQR